MSKEQWLRDAKAHLEQALEILGSDTTHDLQQLKAAAVQSQQAASELWKLTGIAYADGKLTYEPMKKSKPKD